MNNIFPQKRTLKREAITVSAISIIGLGIVMAALSMTGMFQASSSANVSNMGTQHALEYGVDVNWPLSPEFQNIIQVITVNRGGSVTVPVEVTGHSVPSGTSIPLNLVAVNIGKLNQTGQVQGELPVVPPSGMKITFSQPVVTISSGTKTNLNMNVDMSPQTESGTYAFEILGKSTGREIGTTIYISVS